MTLFFKKKKSSKEIIHNAYKELLNREPDETGFNYYLTLLKKNEIDEKKLRDLLQESNEYKKIKKHEFFTKKQKYVFQGKYDIFYNIHPESVLDNIIITNGIYDDFLIQCLSKLIPTNATIFDVGANVGLLSLPFAKVLSPKGIVHVFEPDSEVFSDLLENIKINNFTNIIFKSLALQDDPNLNMITLHKRRAIHDDGRKNAGISTIESNPTYVVGHESVICSTIDNYVHENSIKQIDFLKIDAEGSDFKVLLGSNKIIDLFLPIIVYEFSPEVDRLVGISNTKDCFNFLNSKGYVQYQVTDVQTLNFLNTYDDIIQESNILCIPKNMKLEESFL